MPHNISLITTFAAALGAGLLFGMLALRLRLPALVGYLAAGILIGPATPGFVADVALSGQLAEIGVMLLMFGVGLHFSIKDLLEVRRIALPGAVLQIAFATAMGAALSHWWGWGIGAGLVFGLALSVASTVVLLRALEAGGILGSLNGRIAVGWLVVEDLVTVLVLVLLPALAGPLAELPLSTPREKLSGHVVLVGYGRVGRLIARELADAGLDVVIAEQNRERVDALRRDGAAAVAGDAGEPAVLIQAHIARAAMLVVATPDTLRVRAMIATARALNPAILTVVRSHSESEAALLRGEHAGKVFVGEQELAASMAQHVLANVRAAPAAH